MRLWHKDISSLKTFLSETKPHITISDLWGRTARDGTIKDVEMYFEKSLNPIDDDALEFFLVGTPQMENLGGIHSAVKQIESHGTSNEFLLHAYADGGLISFSKSKLPFENKNAYRAKWWKIEEMALKENGPNPWITNPFIDKLDNLFSKLR